MALFRFLVYWVCLLSGSCLFVTGQDQACQSPQYVELGSRASIDCDFGDTFYGVFWFNTTTITSSERPFMLITESEKSGEGYQSGEFDIKDDGSLIINQVSLQHDHSFAVNVLFTPDGDPNIENVRVIVFVKPQQPYPVIDVCGSKRICYQRSNPVFKVTCSVQDSRPPANLALFLKTSKNDVSLSSNKTVIPSGILSTTLVQATITFSETNRLLLITCQGGIITYTPSEAMVLIENTQSGPLTVDERLNVQLGSHLTLSCGEHNASYFVWRRKGKENAIAFGLGSVYGNATHIFDDEFELGVNNDILVIPLFQTKHVGTYICVFSNGNTTVTKVFDVSIDGTTEEDSKLVYVLIILVLLVILCLAVAVGVLVVLYLKRAKKGKRKTKGKAKQTSSNKNEKIPMIDKATDEEIQAFVSKDITFEWTESNKAQSVKDHTAKIKLLERASSKQMPVRYVKLSNCFESVDISTDRIRLVSGIYIPVISSLETLVLHQDKLTQLEVQDLEQLLLYASKCGLDTLRFNGFRMPYIIKETGSLYDILREKDMNVEWVSSTAVGNLRINQENCCWEVKNSQKLLEKIFYDKLIQDIDKAAETRESAQIATSSVHAEPLLNDQDKVKK